MEVTLTTWFVSILGLLLMGLFFVWDREMGFRKNTFSYWVFVWGMFPAFGVVEMVFCYYRSLGLCLG